MPLKLGESPNTGAEKPDAKKAMIGGLQQGVLKDLNQVVGKWREGAENADDPIDLFRATTEKRQAVKIGDMKGLDALRNQQILLMKPEITNAYLAGAVRALTEWERKLATTGGQSVALHPELRDKVRTVQPLLAQARKATMQFIEGHKHYVSNMGEISRMDADLERAMTTGRNPGEILAYKQDANAVDVDANLKAQAQASETERQKAVDKVISMIGTRGERGVTFKNATSNELYAAMMNAYVALAEGVDTAAPEEVKRINSVDTLTKHEKMKESEPVKPGAVEIGANKMKAVIDTLGFMEKDFWNNTLNAPRGIGLAGTLIVGEYEFHAKTEAGLTILMPAGHERISLNTKEGLTPAIRLMKDLYNKQKAKAPMPANLGALVEALRK